MVAPGLHKDVEAVLHDVSMRTGLPKGWQIHR